MLMSNMQFASVKMVRKSISGHYIAQCSWAVNVLNSVHDHSSGSRGYCIEHSNDRLTQKVEHGKKEHVANEENFFGISDSYKLQQKRSMSRPDRNIKKDQTQEQPLSRRQRRSQNQKGMVHNYLLSYGNVSIDGNSSKKDQFNTTRPEKSRFVLSQMIYDENYTKNKMNNDTIKKHSPQANYFDEIYFPEQFENEDRYSSGNNSDPLLKDQSIVSKDKCDTNPLQLKVQNNVSNKNSIDRVPTGNLEKCDSLNVIDDEYFGAFVKETKNSKDSTLNSSENWPLSPKKQVDNTEKFFDDEQKRKSDNSLGLIDEQYFSNHIVPDKNHKATKNDQGSFDEFYEQYFDARPFEEQNKKHKNTVLEKNHKDVVADTELKEKKKGKLNTESSYQFLKEQNLKSANRSDHVDSNYENNAYDYAMQIRKEIKQKKESTLEAQSADGFFCGSKPRDSKGFQRPMSPSLNWNKIPKGDAVLEIKKRIIFMNDDFIAIDKPYGIPSIGQSHDFLSIQGLLPALGRRLPGGPMLHMVQGLPRDVTGTLLLARSEHKAAILRDMFNSEEEVIQRYWAITKGVPSPFQGIVDIPMCEAKVRGIHKMVLRPRYTEDIREVTGKKTKNDGIRAETQYRVLDSHLQSALVECELLTNKIKDQLRVHMSNGLNTPIIGDHKYSHFTQLKPQKLYPEQLDALKIRQASVRDLGLHLHCRSIILRNYEGNMIFLSSRPPLHFKNTAEKLKLNLPQRYQKHINNYKKHNKLKKDV